MCLEIKGERKIRIAKYNIKVWKLIHKCGNTYITPCVFRPVSKEMKSSIYQFEVDRGVINYGIHSFTNTFAIKNFLIGINTHNFMYVKAIIPKGTKYVIGKKNDIISERLILEDRYYYQNTYGIFKRKIRKPLDL